MSRSIDYDDGADADTNLILDYLANALPAHEADKLEERAQHDRQFRQQLADIVIIKGILMAAIKRDSGPMARECKRAHRQFMPYLRGEASPSATAGLSRHVEECQACELALEELRGSRTKSVEKTNWWGRWRWALAKATRWRPWRTPGHSDDIA